MSFFDWALVALFWVGSNTMLLCRACLTVPEPRWSGALERLCGWVFGMCFGWFLLAEAARQARRERIANLRHFASRGAAGSRP